MTEKELSQLYYLNKETAVLQRNLEELKQQRDYKSPVLTGMPRSSSKKDTGDYIAEITDLEKIINLNLQKIQIERKRLERYIANIENAEIRLIFRLRHVNGMSWEQIGGEIGYTCSGVWRKYNRFLKNCQRNQN